ncbi:MAG: hypothetical protein HY851_07720 [candidate division Zixibacteria bacterium]|nr:hypothetical protein [candidate division Zixibacteria bacterium]
MAQFEPAYRRTLDFEGRYANNPNDRGGETYKGIARKYHPEWSGWALIDAHKSASDFPALLDSDQAIQALVAQCYLTEYWDRIMGDAISDQLIANEVFDSAVNGGVRSAVEILQKALNLFVPVESQIRVDGAMGPETLKSLNKQIGRQVGRQAVLSAMLVYRGLRYIEILNRDHAQREFAVGWFSRLRG